MSAGSYRKSTRESVGKGYQLLDHSAISWDLGTSPTGTAIVSHTTNSDDSNHVRLLIPSCLSCVERTKRVGEHKVMASRGSRFIKTTTTISSVVTNSSMQRRIGSSMFSSCQRAICSLLFLVGILLDVSLSFTTRSNQRQKILFPSRKAVAEDNLENNVGIEKSGRNRQENNSLDSSLGATTIKIGRAHV